MFLNKKLFNSVVNIFSIKSHSHIIFKKMSSFLKCQNKFKVVKKVRANKKHFNLNKVIKHFGISNYSVAKICNKFGLNTRIHILKIKLKTTQKIIKMVNKLTLKDSLKSRLFKVRNFATKQLKNYKGIRHVLRYPVRGQRTHTNNKTRTFLKKRKNSDLN